MNEAIAASPPITGVAKDERDWLKMVLQIAPVQQHVSPQYVSPHDYVIMALDHQVDDAANVWPP